MNPRVSVACEPCRKRKRKCDGLRPACSLCLAKGSPCEYSSEKRAKRKFNADYVGALQDQIALLREELARTRAAASVGGTVLREDQTTEDTVGNDNHSDCHGTGSAPASMTTAIDDVSALIWRMTLDSNGDASFIGPSGNFCFPVTQGTDADPERGNDTGGSTKGHTLGPARGTLWSDQSDGSSVTSHLLDLFARLINPIHQFVDKETLDQLGGDNLSPGFGLLRTAALAAGALFANDAQSKALGDKAAAEVESISLQFCRQLPEISTIQALSIMSWRELGLEQHNMAWMYNSMCASLVLHLGLPLNMPPETRSSASGHDCPRESDTQAIRVRALWSSVLMDRIATSLLGRNCLVPWTRTRAPPFLSAVCSSPSVEELAFDHQCCLWFIHDQYMDRIYSFDFASLDSTEKFRFLLDARDQLYSFHQQIHPALQATRHSSSNSNSTAVTPATIYLHIAYHMSQILVHRPYLKEASQTTPNPKLYTLCSRTVSAAAAAIVRLLREYRKIAPLDEVPPFIVHSVLTAAVAHLCNTTNSANRALRTQSTAHFRACFLALIAMRRRWVAAQRAVGLLRGLARRWQVMRALPLQHGFEPPLGYGGLVVMGQELGPEPESDGEGGRCRVDGEGEEEGLAYDGWSWGSGVDYAEPGDSQPGIEAAPHLCDWASLDIFDTDVERWALFGGGYY